MYMLLRGAHYDLVVPEESITEKYSTERKNEDDKDDGYKPEKEDEEEEEEEEEEEGEEDENEEDDSANTAEKRLNELEAKYTTLHQKYTKCVAANRKLRAERRSALVNHEGKEKSRQDDDSSEVEDSSEEEDTLAYYKSKGYRNTNPQNEPYLHLRCELCRITFYKEKVWKTHMAKHNEDGDWTCGEFDCNFQTNSEVNLREHKNRVHTTKSAPPIPSEGNGNRRPKGNTCNTCGEDLIYKIDLTKHVTQAHMTYKPCRDLQTCTYAPKCRYNHREYPVGHQVCFECGKSFKTMHELMRHRKSSHIVPLCKLFQKNSCGFSTDDCYNTHNKASEPVKNVANNTIEGFWEGPKNTAPPLTEPSSQKGPTQAEWLQMKQALMQINKMMQKFQQ